MGISKRFNALVFKTLTFLHFCILLNSSSTVFIFPFLDVMYRYLHTIKTKYVNYIGVQHIYIYFFKLLHLFLFFYFQFFVFPFLILSFYHFLNFLFFHFSFSHLIILLYFNNISPGYSDPHSSPVGGGNAPTDNKLQRRRRRKKTAKERQRIGS